MKAVSIHIMRRFWPLITLFFLTLVIFFLNYTPGTFLTGGDNLHPEFALDINIKRSIFAVWQEYQGLGLLGGMGHASDLLRQLFLLPFSYVIPMSLLRYFWTMLTLFLGGVGTYFLLQNLLKTSASKYTSRFLPFIGSLFYMTNLATIQTYYSPFEVFTAHFASLPWMLWAGISYTNNPTKKSLFLFAVITLLSTPGSYVPTLFVVTAIALAVMTRFALPHAFSVKRKLFTLSKMWLVLFVINLFWLLPFAYFTLTSANVNVNAKINQMATETVFLQNKEFGHISDVILLKGFLFNNVEPNIEGEAEYMLLPWRNHLANPAIATIGYILFFIVVLGALQSFKKRSVPLFGVVTLFVLSIIMLTTATFPLSTLNEFIRQTIPLVNQVFRFPFTKFSILAGLTYAILFVFGIQFILEKLRKSRLQTVTLVISGLLLVTFSFPIFQGHFFYAKARLQIPKEYFDTFAFFHAQDPTTRIANFPHHSFWGWNYYRWGYGGSGFMWYGIEQPILDRAFDVWSKTNENYYFEMAQALYKKDTVAIENVLNKYQVSWLLVDRSLLYPSAPKSLFYKESEELFLQIPTITKAKTFGDITIYHVALKQKPQSYVFTTPVLPKINSYAWSGDDQAYAEYDNYEAVDDTPISKTSFYPFRSLFSGKTPKEQAFVVKEAPQSLVFTAKLPKTTPQTMLRIPSLSQSDASIPVILTTKKASNGTIAITATIRSPQVYQDNAKIWGSDITLPLFTLVPEKATDYDVNLNINGVVNISLPTKKDVAITSFLSLRQDNILLLTDVVSREQQSITISESSFAQLALFSDQLVSLHASDKPTTLSVHIPKITDNYLNLPKKTLQKPDIKNCNMFRQGEIEIEQASSDKTTITSTDATACFAFYAPQMVHDQGYATFVTAENKTGRGLHMWIENIDQQYSPIETYLPSEKKTQTFTFILPQMESFGNSYAFHFDNISIGNSPVTNIFHSVTSYPIPYTFLTRLALQGEYLPKTDSQTLNVTHTNQGSYQVSAPVKKQTTIVLSQSYDPLWKAYRVKKNNLQVLSVLFGKEEKGHIRVNNWENGWNITEPLKADEAIQIVYLPQYLQYAGATALIAISVFFLLTFIRLDKRA